jgi:osmotically-inducible protein OsmY
MQQELTRHDSQPLPAEVHHALANNPHLAGRKLRVEMRDDHVVLSGELGSYYHKQMAQEAIRSIGGIRKVRNEIQVVSL